jgi:hypothetical protein
MNKHLKVGIGGISCVCCFPASGSKARRILFRRAKKKEKREAMRLEKINSDRKE